MNKPARLYLSSAFFFAILIDTIVLLLFTFANPVLGSTEFLLIIIIFTTLGVLLGMSYASLVQSRSG